MKYLLEIAHSLGLGIMFLWSYSDIIVIGDAMSADEAQAMAMRHSTALRDTNKLACLACSGFLMPK